MQSAGAVLELFSFDVPTSANPRRDGARQFGFQRVGLADGSPLTVDP
jgi:hypothetical protein